MNPEERLDAVLAAARIDVEKIVALMSENPNLVDTVFRELSNRSGRIKFSCSKSLVILSERHPGLLYSRLDKVLKLLESENQILKWNGITILGNLAAADQRGQVRTSLPRLYAFLSSGELITANTAIAAMGKIGRALPEERKTIVSRLIEIRDSVFDTDECRNIAIGKSILAMEMFLDRANTRKDVLEFVRSQTDNSRKATAAKAKAFLRKYA